jgi:Ca2+-dependent lipid-binding protein
VIKDDRDLAADPILGTYQVKLDDMLKLMEKGQEWYNLAGAQTGRVKMTLQWKPVALTGVGASTGGYVTPIGVVRLHFKNARNLCNLETLGKSDPYVRVLLSGIEKGRTVTFQNNLNPDWDEVIYVPVHSTREKLVLEVMDQESVGSDRSLGSIEVALTDYVSQAENGEYRIHDEKRLQAGVLRSHGKGSPKGTLNHTISFYPLLNIADPEEDKPQEKVEEYTAEVEPARKNSSERGRISLDMNGTKTKEVDSELAKTLSEGEKEQVETTEEKKLQKIHLTPEQLLKYESGLIIFKLMDVELTENDLQVEVLMDDMVFPSYTSSVIRGKKSKLDEIGDCFVRELDFSKITLRVREKGKLKGDHDKDHNDVWAKLTGDTIVTLKQCLVSPLPLFHLTYSQS